jgi:tRNA G37 N-methylase Trm5
MIEISFLNKNDTVIDLCAGTGGFMIDSLKKNVPKVIGIE